MALITAPPATLRCAETETSATARSLNLGGDWPLMCSKPGENAGRCGITHPHPRGRVQRQGRVVSWLGKASLGSVASVPHRAAFVYLPMALLDIPEPLDRLLPRGTVYRPSLCPRRPERPPHRRAGARRHAAHAPADRRGGRRAHVRVGDRARRGAGAGRGVTQGDGGRAGDVRSVPAASTHAHGMAAVLKAAPISPEASIAMMPPVPPRLATSASAASQAAWVAAPAAMASQACFATTRRRNASPSPVQATAASRVA